VENGTLKDAMVLITKLKTFHQSQSLVPKKYIAVKVHSSFNHLHKSLLKKKHKVVLKKKRKKMITVSLRKSTKKERSMKRKKR
jgi:hypothetical protein